VETAGASLDTTDALDAAIVSARRILNAPSSIFELQFPSASSDLPELLRQAEERLVNLRREAKAAVAKQLEHAEQSELLDPYGLVQSAMAESSAQIEQRQQSSIEPRRRERYRR
jgi:protein-tyrosine-phosphatase